MKLRRVPQGHETYDVYHDLRLLGSVWHYRDGWAAYNRRMSFVSGDHPSALSAAERLTRAGVDSVS